MRQTDLAGTTSLPASHISELERGARLPTIPTLRKIGAALNRPLEYFFHDMASPPRSFGMVIHLASIDGQGIAHFARLVEKRTNGEVKLRVYHSSELGSSRNQLNALIEGGIHIFIGEPHCFETYAPLCGSVFLPYYFKDRNHYNRFLKSKIFNEEIVQKLLKKGIRLLNPASNWELGSFEVLFSTKPIFCPEDLKGLKLRTYPSQTAIQLRKILGAEPVVVDWDGLYAAFEQGQINALLIPAGYLAALKLHRIARYATLLRTGYTLNLTLAVNEHEFSKLSPSAQDALLETCEEAGEYCTGLANKKTEADLAALSEKYGLPVIQPDQKLWRETFVGAIEQICSQDKTHQDAFERIQRL
ncbi:MAG: TRAP transporter substrate-binding protein DctP [Desulfohalobiaceae bacterium]|nr:TRAP transporter substrate-binding protein DctP [Desulfohalobiaceae bacterium]